MPRDPAKHPLDDRIRALCHRLVHDYFAIDNDAVWLVVERDLPALVRALESGLNAWPVPLDSAGGER